MNITILKGSPHTNGTTNLLTEYFIKGALENGHNIQSFDTAKELIHPCLGCNHCRKSGNECVYKDGMEKLNPMLMDSDIVVLVTPLYYFGMSAQIKAALDRFFANNTLLRSQKKHFILISACGDNDSWAMDGLKAHYECLCRYMHWESAGELYAYGMYVKEDLLNSPYLEQAYNLGLSL